MYCVSDDILDRWMRENAPYGDLTSWTLGLDRQPGRIAFTAREPMVICGTEEVVRLMEKHGAKAKEWRPSGESVEAGETLLEAEGSAGDLHRAWKVSINVLEHSSGIATRTRRFVDQIRGAGSRAELAATCKGYPGTRELTAKAIMAGGGSLHRLGLSETVLVFDHHRAFFASFEDFVRRIPEWKSRSREKKFVVEAESMEEAMTLAKAGVDGIQFDKTPSTDLAEHVKTLRSLRSELVLIAAGGINEQNAAEYAATGVDVLATSAVYFGKPADIGVRLLPR